jgi:hypothetical protein
VASPCRKVKGEAMADEIRCTVRVESGDEGYFFLREPTKAEWRFFLRDRYPIKKGVMVNHSSPARQALFDKLLLRVENACDGKGELTANEKHRIPGKMKEESIFVAFEEGRDPVSGKKFEEVKENGKRFRHPGN